MNYRTSSKSKYIDMNSECDYFWNSFSPKINIYESMDLYLIFFFVNFVSFSRLLSISIMIFNFFNKIVVSNTDYILIFIVSELSNFLHTKQVCFRDVWGIHYRINERTCFKGAFDLFEKILNATSTNIKNLKLVWSWVSIYFLFFFFVIWTLAAPSLHDLKWFQSRGTAQTINIDFKIHWVFLSVFMHTISWRGLLVTNVNLFKSFILLYKHNIYWRNKSIILYLLIFLFMFFLLRLFNFFVIY